MTPRGVFFRIGAWALIGLSTIGPLGCQGDGHGGETRSGLTEGEAPAGADEAASPLEELEFEVDDPGGVPSEVGEAREALSLRIAQRSDDVAEAELAVAQRARSLDQLERELDARLGSIEGLEKRLQTQLGIGKVAHERRDERISALAELVATMTPQAGAELVAQLSDDDAQWILMSIARRSQRKAAKLMAAMPSDRAATLGQRYLDHDPKTVAGGEGLGPLDSTTAPAAAAEDALARPAPALPSSSSPAASTGRTVDPATAPAASAAPSNPTPPSDAGPKPQDPGAIP